MAAAKLENFVGCCEKTRIYIYRQKDIYRYTHRRYTYTKQWITCTIIKSTHEPTKTENIRGIPILPYKIEYLFLVTCISVDQHSFHRNSVIRIRMHWMDCYCTMTVRKMGICWIYFNRYTLQSISMLCWIFERGYGACVRVCALQ